MEYCFVSSYRNFNKLKFRQPFTLRAKELDQIDVMPDTTQPFDKKGCPKGDSVQLGRAPIWFRFFIAGFIVLIALFLLSWLPGAHIDLTVASEPFIINFKIILDQSAKNVFFNLGTIPAQVVSVEDYKNKKEYIVIDELINEKGDMILVFKQDDLKKLVVYKAEELLKGSEVNSVRSPLSLEGGRNQRFLTSNGVKKQIFEFHPDLWEIHVLEKDILSGVATISIFIQEEVVQVYDFESLKTAVRFKNVGEAKEILTKVSGIKWASINIFPPFYSRLPVFDSRMKFFVHP